MQLALGCCSELLHVTGLVVPGAIHSCAFLVWA
jgi:hypothetical protein